jgi:hypothetical protein
MPNLFFHAAAFGQGPKFDAAMLGRGDEEAVIRAEVCVDSYGVIR